MALTCLGEFAKHIDIKHAVTVNLTALHDKTFHKQFEITNDNYEITQRTEVKVTWITPFGKSHINCLFSKVPINDVLTAVTTGNGLGLVQVFYLKV